MLTPRKIKHRKQQKGVMRKLSTKGYTLEFGRYGLKALEAKFITARQIEAARRAITRHIQRGGKIWIRIFPDKPITTTPPETGMGGGKGAVDHYVAPVSPGRIIFEMDGIEEPLAREALTKAAGKLPIKTVYIVKEQE